MLQDFRFAFRTLRRTPGFTFLSVAALGLCIGANTAIFTIVNTVLFRPLDFPQQERLVYAGEGLPKLGYPEVSFSCPDYLFVASHNRLFQSTAVYRTRPYELSGIDRPERVYAARVTASLFSVLDVRPAVGRTFTEAEDDQSNNVAVVTDGFAKRVFGGPNAAVGRTVYLERKPYTVVGVMPAQFSFPLRGRKYNSEPADIFLPASWTKDERQSFGENYDLDFIGRLRPDVTVAQAGAPESLPRLHDIGLDWRVLCFVAAVTLTTPLVFCFAPAINISRAAIADRLREGTRTGTQSKQQRHFMSTAVVTQFVLAFLLLSGAGLLIRSFIRAIQSDPGFQPDHVVSVGISLPSTAYRKPQDVEEFHREVLQRVSVLPGVLEAGDISDLPMSRTGNNVYTVEGRKAKENTFRFYVSGNAMRLLRLPLLRGRYIDARDGPNAPLAVVISESIAKRNWPGQEPIGRRVKFGAEASRMPWMTVVGVVKDVRDSLSSMAPRSLMFLSATAHEQIFHSSVRNRQILVRTSQNDPAILSRSIQQQIRQLDPALPLQQVQTLDQYLGKSLEPERFRTFLLATFAEMALLLAILGIAGLLAYNVAQRTKEFGVRIALGASQRGLVSAVVKEGLRVALLGITLGVAASFLATRAIAALLYDTSQYDLLTYTAVAMLLAFVGLAASILPGWRASRPEPMKALRAE